MQELQAAAMTLGWPVVIALAWALGEFGHRWTGLPRISLYGLVGFLFGPGQMAWVPASSTGTMILLANVAFGLILFEFGYRIREWSPRRWHVSGLDSIHPITIRSRTIHGHSSEAFSARPDRQGLAA
ncbi:MAG: hypothetical protein E6H58_15195 [Betaproteobacteria bacterium]|nr:MAG: hypothetical protein E6H58_15195 [Betaproteobacteria bacterium]